MRVWPRSKAVRRRLALAFALAAASAGAACGSRVDEQAAIGGGESQEAAELGSDSAAAERGSGASTSSARSRRRGTGSQAGSAATANRVGTGEGGSGSSPGGSGPGGPPPGAGSSWLPPGAGVRGVTDEVVRIGMVTFDAQLAADAANGVSGSEGERTYYTPGGNFQRANEAVVDWVNATGGIAGRRVEPVYQKVTPERWVTADGRAQDMQAACATWTEDRPVFAFSGYFAQFEQGLDCAADARTPIVAMDGQAYPSRPRFEEMAPYWYGPHHFLSERRERALVGFLGRHGFWSSGARVAVMIENEPGVRDGVERGLLPALAAAGFEDPMQIVYPDFISSPWPNYVLQMQTAGITHVVFSAQVARGSYPALFMMRAAEEQGLDVQWALGTDNSRSLVEMDAPAEQLAKVLGMGWYPSTWFGEARAQTGNLRACADVMQGIGEPEMLGDSQCELLLFLRAALARAPELGPAGLATGAAALGDGGWSSLYTIGGATRFAPGRHDGAATVQAFTYDAQAGNFRYRGSPEPTPER